MEKSLVEFTETAPRHYCRNPKCRSKLKAPVSNSKEAFCPTTSCRERFYRLRCYVCEEKKSGRLDAHTCGRRKCKNAIRLIGPPYHAPRVEIAIGKPIKSGLPERPKTDRYIDWAISANSARIRAPRRVLKAVFGDIPLLGGRAPYCHS
jgi:hypothetical protein